MRPQAAMVALLWDCVNGCTTQPSLLNEEVLLGKEKAYQYRGAILGNARAGILSTITVKLFWRQIIRTTMRRLFRKREV